MITTRAIKGAKLEKPRPLRMLQRAVSDPGTKHHAGEAAVKTEIHGLKAVKEHSGNKVLNVLENLVKQLEGRETPSIGEILDLCQILHDKGAQLENDHPDFLQKCFSVVRFASKKDSISKETRMLLLELVELRARGWQTAIPDAPPQACKTKEELNRSDSSFEKIELNSSSNNPVEVKWNSAGHMWQCEMVLPSDKVEKVRANTKYRARVLEILASSKIIISKDVVWNHRQIVLLGKKGEVKNAARYILEVMKSKENQTNGGGDHPGTPVLSYSDLSDAGEISMDSSIQQMDKSGSRLSNSHSMDPVIKDENSNALGCQSQNSGDKSLPVNQTETSVQTCTVPIIITETADEEVQTETVNSTNGKSAVSKFEHQSLLQFAQGTLCLCANPADKAILTEAKVVLQEHFCPEQKRRNSVSPGKSLTSADIHLARCKSADDSRIAPSSEQSYSENMSHNKSGIKYMRSLSTPERGNNTHRSRLGCDSSRNRSDTCKSDDSSAFTCYKNESLDENQFTKELLDRLQPPERGARVSSSTPDATPEGSPAGSPMSDAAGETVKAHVKAVRQPIIAGTTDLEELEETMPSGLYTSKGRRAMFRKYSEQVLRAQGQDWIEDTKPKIKYTTEELLAFATSKNSRSCPKDWSYLRHIFPDICLENVTSYFDPAPYIERRTGDKPQFSVRPFWKSRSDLEQRENLTDEKMDNSCEVVRDQ